MAVAEYGVGAAGPKFEPYLEANSVNERWLAWMRNFNYYLEGQIGLSTKQKIARLLHQAGPDVQEIFEGLEECEEDSGKDEFDKTVSKLNRYFAPKININYERQMFRSLNMEEGETIDSFAVRLRRKSKYCKFPNKEETIRDQIIEKCNNVQLKRKFLKKELTLDQILEVSRIFEMEKKMSSCEISDATSQGPSQVNLLKPKVINSKCFRCGYTGHFAKDSSCPAVDKICEKCGLKGHFKKQCKTRPTKTKSKKKYIKYVIEEESNSESESEYECNEEDYVQSIFPVMSVSDNKCDIEICKQNCKFIIDSGAMINIIDKKTYRELLKCGLQCKLVNSKSQKYCAYGGREIPKLGIFKTNLFSPDTKINVTASVLVYDGKGPALLSRDTSIELGLLRVGPETTVMSTYTESANTCLDKQKVMSMFPELFTGVGKLKNFELKIPINPKVPLVAQPVRRQPFNIRQIEKDLIKELLDFDIIEPVTGPTPCVSPSHIVQKKEKGQHRLVVDMRMANEAVQRERVPLPTFEELLNDLNGCKIFSKIDIKWGYHQILLSEDSRIITVFSCSLGLFRYKRLFFGIRCASEIFQRIVSQLLQGIEGVANSQDDIRIGGRTQEEHDCRLKIVLERLRQSGITLNESKCVFGVPEINFLGHHLSANGIKPTQTSQQVLQEFRAPENKAEVRSFLGLINFSARFVPNFSTITEPLRELTKKNSEFIWQDEHQKAFQMLKDIIGKAPALGYYDKDADTTLITDASPVGIADILIQHQNVNNQKHPVPIKYISRALTPTEQRYSQTEKEALAIIWACENLYMYLLGKEFKIISDHKPLEVIYSVKSKPSARIQRWVLRLQPYTFKVIYKPGKNNIADPLSRLLDTKKEPETSEDKIEENSLLGLIETITPAVTVEEVRDATIKDDELISVKKAIEMDVWPKELRKYELIKTELCIVDEIVLRGFRIIIPKELTAKILEIGHEGHIAANGMKNKLRAKVWWRTMDKDIEHWTDTCDGCRLVRKSASPEPLMPTELPSKVWEQVAIDYLGPLPSGHYLLFIVDYYSRFYEVNIFKNPTAENTIEALRKIIAREGIMDILICDNGPAFIDQRFVHYIESHGIKLRHSTPLWPQANGEVERQNRNVLRRLRIAQATKKDWKEELLTYLSAYRTTPHSTTGVPPGELFRGRAIKTKIPELIKLGQNYEDEGIRDKDR